MQQLQPMFVKQAYEKRLKNEEDQLTKLQVSRRTKQPRIGSIRNDKINYDKEEQFFTKEDIPLHARTIKEEINNLIDPDHLNQRQKPWNASVSLPKSFEKEETHEQKLLKIKLGFTDPPPPKYKQPVLYTGCDTRNDYTKWNVSNQPIPKQIKENLLKKTHSAFQNTKAMEEKFLNSYNNPLMKTVTHIQRQKQKEVNEGQMRQKLRQNYIFDNPTASEERIRGAVHRMAYETVVKQRQDEIACQAMRTDFKASLSTTQRSKMGVQFKHSGVWQKFEVRGEQNWAWSCCQNEQKQGRGCQPMLKDGNRWNLCSFNNH